MDDETFKLLETALEKEKAKPPIRIRESKFKQSLLPVVVGLHNQEKVDLGYWVGTVGSLYVPVTVVDDNNVELFTTPPLINAAELQNDKSLYNAMAMSEKVAANGGDPKVALTRHYNENGSLSFERPGGSIALEWQRIFARYGIRMQSVDETNTPSETPQEAAVSEPDVQAQEGLDDGIEFA